MNKLKKHPHYDDVNIVNDIALLFLDSPVKLNNHIQMACLPQSVSSKYPGENLDAYVAGWGLLHMDDSFTPDLLHNLKLSILPSSFCSYSDFSDEAMICAGKYCHCIEKFSKRF